MSQPSQVGLSTEVSEDRHGLDRAMAVVLHQLDCCANGATANYQGSSGGGKPGARVLAGGDTGEADYYRRAYGPPFHHPTTDWPGARNDRERAALIGRARHELEHLRGYGGAQRARPSETPDAERTRLLAETRGHSPDEVAQSRHKIAAKTLRKWRRDAGLNAETGEPLAGVTGTARVVALALLQEGKSVRYVAMQTGIAKSIIHRWGKEDAA